MTKAWETFVEKDTGPGHNKVNNVYSRVLRLRYKSYFVAGNDGRCNVLLRRLLRNPPNNTKIAINIGLSKARYTCHKGHKLVGKEVRTCRGGKWRESVEPKCFSKFKSKLEKAHYILNYSTFWNDVYNIREIQHAFPVFVRFVKGLSRQEAQRTYLSV